MMAKLERSPQQARMEAVSRDALVQAALQEITQNYREASLSNVARAYGVSLAYVSECAAAGISAPGPETPPGAVRR